MSIVLCDRCGVEVERASLVLSACPPVPEGLAEWLADQLEFHGVRRRTLQDHKRRVMRLARFATSDGSGMIGVDAISLRVGRQFLRELLNRKGKRGRHTSGAAMSPGTVNGYVKSIRRFALWSVRAGHCRDAPVMYLERVRDRGRLSKANRHPPRRISADEHGRYLSRLLQEREDVGLVIAVMYLTASRPSQVFEVRRSDVDFAGGVVQLCPCKGAPGKSVPMSGELTKTLRRAIDVAGEVHGRRPVGRQRVFRNRLGGAWTTEAFCRAFRAACDRAGVRDWWPYDVRHRACTRMHERGVAAAAVMHAMGHLSITTQDVYGHSSGRLGAEGFREL